MPQVLDIEQAVLLLEIEPPFDKREIQLARRRLAKQWHPDIAPPGKQLEHERHLKAVNEAADQLSRLAEESRGGSVARDADPRNLSVLRLLPTAYWQAGDFAAAARAVRDWIREEPGRPAPHRTAARIYEDMGALTQALDESVKECAAAPSDVSAWERLGRLRLRAFYREGAREALERARSLGASEQGLLDLALVAHLAGDVGAEVTACLQATELAPDSAAAWARYAHALARTDRLSDCLAACERTLELADDPEVRDLREQVLATAPRELDARTAA